MLKHILPLIPSHTLYTESFCGGAAVFFAKDPSDGEVINDLNQQMTNFYEMLKTEYDLLKARVDVTVHSRDIHAHAAHILEYPQFFTRMDRAWAVWALSKMSFASMLDGTFGYDFGGGMPKKLRNAKEEFGEHLARRLDNVTIENRDALEVIRCYDTPPIPSTSSILPMWGVTAGIMRVCSARATCWLSLTSLQRSRASLC